MASITGLVARLRMPGDFLLALAGLAVTHLRVNRADDPWDWAPLWLTALVTVAPALIVLRSKVPVVVAVLCSVVAQLSLLLGETDWVMLAGAGLALATVARRRRLGPALLALVLTAGVVPLLSAWRWQRLVWWAYPQTYFHEDLPDGTSSTTFGIHGEDLDRIAAGGWQWWLTGVVLAVWVIALVRRLRSGEQLPTDHRTPGQRFDEVREYVGRHRLGADVLLAAALAGFTLLAIRRGQTEWVTNWWTAPAWMILSITYAPLTLVLRRIKPVVPCVVLAVTAYFSYWQVEDSWKLLVAFAVALYSLAALRPVRLSVPVSAALLGLLPVAAALTGQGLLFWLFPVVRERFYAEVAVLGDASGGDYARLAERQWPLSLSLIMALPVCLGVLARSYRRTAEAGRREAVLLRRTAEQDLEQRRLTERAHIARDLHDVIAHHVNLMVIQAEAGPDLLRLGEAELGFRLIGDAGRRALGELDRVLSALRDEAHLDLVPQPGLKDLRRLVADVPGLEVSLELDGSFDQVPDGHQLTAYRIVQEGLTNVVRHAKARVARVVVVAEGNGLRVEVRDDGAGFVVADVADGRHGLAGMRERVKVHSGTLEIMSEPGAGTEVTAWLPIP